MLDGKHVLITGANRGIGLATAKLCVACKANVYLAGRDEAGLEAIAEQLGAQAVAFCYDLTDPQQVKEAFGHLQTHVGRLDGLVNNAGVMKEAPIGMTKITDLQAQLDINTVAPFLHCQMGSRLMSRNRHGSIVNVCSIVGEKGAPGQAAYSASKAALSGVTKSLAKELAPMGIRVNGVAPGFIETNMTEHYQSEKRQDLLKQIPMGRAGTPDEVANLIVYLLSDHTTFLTGQIIGLDGGMTL